MNAPTFLQWTDRERDDEVVALANRRKTSVSLRTWRRWRHHAKHGATIYQELIADLNQRVRHAWTPAERPHLAPNVAKGDSH